MPTASHVVNQINLPSHQLVLVLKLELLMRKRRDKLLFTFIDTLAMSTHCPLSSLHILPQSPVTSLVAYLDIVIRCRIILSFIQLSLAHMHKPANWIEDNSHIIDHKFSFLCDKQFLSPLPHVQY